MESSLNKNKMLLVSHRTAFQLHLKYNLKAGNLCLILILPININGYIELVEVICLYIKLCFTVKS